MQIAVIGGGPAGLRAAEVAANGGAAVTVFDAKPSVGRKFLVAGRGGLNLTHAEDSALFHQRYQGPQMPADLWPSLLADFDAAAARAWAEGLGIETFVASTGRVYPKEMKAAPLLRRWVNRLRGLGVEFAMHHRWRGLKPGQPLHLEFETPGANQTFEAAAAIFAMGGASWPGTGSDGGWVAAFSQLGVNVSPLQPANCGWEVAWPPGVITQAEGEPLKNIAVRVDSASATGELMPTHYGLEGGAIYQVGAALRAMAKPMITIDFKPELSIEELIARFKPSRLRLLLEAQKQWRLSDATVAILDHHPERASLNSVESLAAAVKGCRIELLRPRPIAEAISSAGGIAWSELDDSLMIRRIPGVFVAGEMIDWEAPTGGYLMQGCLATGTRAARGALRFGQ